MKRAIVAMLAVASMASSEAVEFRDGWYEVVPGVAGIYGRYGDRLQAMMVMNMPPSDIIGAARSARVNITASCAHRAYTITWTGYYSGEWMGGMLFDASDADNMMRRVVDSSPFGKLFAKACGK